MSEAELRRLLIDCALIGEVHASTWNGGKPEALSATAQRLRIDGNKIRQALKDELAAKAQRRGKTAMKQTVVPAQSVAPSIAPRAARSAKAVKGKPTKKTQGSARAS
jgi:hypothetical protein